MQAEQTIRLNQLSAEIEKLGKPKNVKSLINLLRLHRRRKPDMDALRKSIHLTGNDPSEAHTNDARAIWRIADRLGLRVRRPDGEWSANQVDEYYGQVLNAAEKASGEQVTPIAEPERELSKANEATPSNLPMSQQAKREFASTPSLGPGDWIMPPRSLAWFANQMGNITTRSARTILERYRLMNWPEGHRQSFTADQTDMPAQLKKQIGGKN